MLFYAVLFFGLFTYKNRPLQPDYFEYYENQDTAPVGKVGIFVTGLVAPPEHSSVFYYNVVNKVFNTLIPWPFRIFAKADKGVVLLDPEQFYESRRIHSNTP